MSYAPLFGDDLTDLTLPNLRWCFAQQSALYWHFELYQDLQIFGLRAARYYYYRRYAQTH